MMKMFMLSITMKNHFNKEKVFMDPYSIEYKRKVWLFLDNMEIGKMYTIDKLCRRENREGFIEAIKEYMGSFRWYGNITFNRDYTKIYRTHPPIVK